MKDWRNTETQDSISCQTAKKKNFAERVKQHDRELLKLLQPWSSPDSNLIKHQWDVMKQAQSTEAPTCNTKESRKNHGQHRDITGHPEMLGIHDLTGQGFSGNKTRADKMLGS